MRFSGKYIRPSASWYYGERFIYTGWITFIPLRFDSVSSTPSLEITVRRCPSRRLLLTGRKRLSADGTPFVTTTTRPCPSISSAVAGDRPLSSFRNLDTDSLALRRARFRTWRSSQHRTGLHSRPLFLVAGESVLRVARTCRPC